MRADSPLPITGTVLAAVVADVIAAAATLGVPRAELLAASGLTEADLVDPDARVPVAADIAIWVTLSRRPIGLALGEHLGAGTMGAVGYAMQHGRRVGDALEWIQRFRAVLHPELVPLTEVRQTPMGPRLVFSKPMAGPFAQLREPVYAYASGTRALLRGLTGEPIEARSVTYPLPKPADASVHEAWFRCPVSWGATRYEMAFDATVLDRPLPRNDARLFAYLAQQAERLLAAAPHDDSLTSRVRRDVATALATGEPQQAPVAKRLAMSARTMQRRLADEGTTFAAIVEAVRQERAEVLLSDATLTASEVSFLLGFSEPAAFFRAFRRWRGMTPQEWRTNHRGRAQS
jgi:AraC-like DNA-binding protein